MHMPSELASRTTIGSWLQLADPNLTEMMLQAGFDWLTIDLEHTSTTLEQAAELVRICAMANVPVFARLSGHDTNEIKRLLDMGASGIIAPDVRTAQQAQRLADACFYPPRGTRGVGLARAQGYGRSFDAYRDGAANDVMFIPQIEHIDAVRNLGNILDVKGVAGFFVGPYDLSGSLGLPGDFEHPDVVAALEAIAGFIRPEGPFAGIHVVEPDIEQLEEAIGKGYRFIAFASEMLIFSQRIEELAAGIQRLR
jgi:2-dehydro-3-deoxyglucarate aldolase